MLDFIKKVLKPKPAASPTGKLAKDDVVDVVKLGLLVSLAAGLEFAVQHVGGVDFGVYSPFVVLGLTTALDFVNKLVKTNEEK